MLQLDSTRKNVVNDITATTLALGTPYDDLQHLALHLIQKPAEEEIPKAVDPHEIIRSTINKDKITGGAKVLH
ncbi:unnamed protein product [Didymodactylos carnosus]|uniref:Uncharacterized protein n=1 Tax=Didymodactylos carnosus TaxID=1234261 RepID=A0A8S2SK47_9BILA|nr:unnamed protein product [Didymodactylos carnosus]CAF4226509.1 unnamed protein product [Didymodactylos carnosus]